MKSAIAAIISTTLLSANAVVLPKRLVGGLPFYLSLSSADPTLNNLKLGTCHIGAGIKSICAYQDDFQLFNLNSTTSEAFPENAISQGTLILQDTTEFMGLNTLIDSNVAPAIFGLNPASVVVIDTDDRMGFSTFYDDATDPPTFVKGEEILTDRWRMCQYNFEGYVYNTLSWEYGNSVPTQPSCQAVTVRQTFPQ